MKLFINSTSPYARIARIALSEKGYSSVEEQIVNPWSDDPELIAANTAARVPVLITDSGDQITESLLIVLWLESHRPKPSLIATDGAGMMQTAGIAFGVLEAAVHTMVGRVIQGASFDEAPVGLRRRRTILKGLQQLEDRAPVYNGGTPDLSIIVTVTAFEYVLFRFHDAAWLNQYPTLERLKNLMGARESFSGTRPFA